MKKFIYMAVAAIAALSSCSNEDDPIMGETGKQALTFTASMESGVTRATYNSENKCASWETTDQISINGKTYNAQSAGLTTTFTAVGEEATLDGGKYKAYFPASMYNSTTVTLPASYTYTADKFDMPMYAESTTTELSFKNLCGVLAITVSSTQMSSVTSIVVSSDKQMNGAISAITSEGVLTFATGTLTDAKKKVTLTATSPVTISTGSNKTFYVPVPAGTHNPLTITVSDGTNTKVMITKKSGGVSIVRNKIYPITFKDNTFLGSFSVSTTKKVKFTKSNLYWDGSAFHFEAKPTGFPNTRETTHVGHFFWHTTAAASYAASYDGTGATPSDQFFADGSDDAHKLTVDGVSGLYALSKDEWNYLIINNIKSFNVTVGGVGGCLVIAPDNFTGTIATSYTLEEFDEAGLLCLPPAGYYEDGNIYGQISDDVDVYGYYWSSTPHATLAAGASQMYFWAGGTTNMVDNFRNRGMSLRAVLAE